MSDAKKTLAEMISERMRELAEMEAAAVYGTSATISADIDDVLTMDSLKKLFDAKIPPSANLAGPWGSIHDEPAPSANLFGIPIHVSPYAPAPLEVGFELEYKRPLWRRLLEGRTADVRPIMEGQVFLIGGGALGTDPNGKRIVMRPEELALLKARL